MRHARSKDDGHPRARELRGNQRVGLKRARIMSEVTSAASKGYGGCGEVNLLQPYLLSNASKGRGNDPGGL